MTINHTSCSLKEDEYRKRQLIKNVSPTTKFKKGKTHKWKMINYHSHKTVFQPFSRMFIDHTTLNAIRQRVFHFRFIKYLLAKLAFMWTIQPVFNNSPNNRDMPLYLVHFHHVYEFSALLNQSFDVFRIRTNPGSGS